MAKARDTIDEKMLTKGELRKLNALRNSVGKEIGEKAFAQWYEQKEAGSTNGADPNITLIEKALTKLTDKLRFPRGGGYHIKRGRGRIIVERV